MSDRIDPEGWLRQHITQLSQERDLLQNELIHAKSKIEELEEELRMCRQHLGYIGEQRG